MQNIITLWSSSIPPKRQEIYQREFSQPFRQCNLRFILHKMLYISTWDVVYVSIRTLMYVMNVAYLAISIYK